MATERKKQQDRERMRVKRLAADNERAQMISALKRIASVLDEESYPDNGSLESQLGKIARLALPKPS